MFMKAKVKKYFTDWNGISNSDHGSAALELVGAVEAGLEADWDIMLVKEP